MAKTITQTVHDVADRITSHLQARGYRSSSIEQFRCVWRKLETFAASTNPGAPWGPELCVEFLKSELIPITGPISRERPRFVRTAVRILTEFATSGSFRRRALLRAPTRPLGADLQTALSRYLDFCATRLRVAARTLRQRTAKLRAFLGFLGTQRVTLPSAIRPHHATAFIATQKGWAPTTKADAASIFRSFFKIGFALGDLPTNLSASVAAVPRSRAASIPSVWKTQEVDILVGAVKTSSALGKRDLAILLLACRLGIRVGDIRALTLDDLNWSAQTIRVRQSKTGTPVVLPMTDEVARALIAYLRDGRPRSSHREIFLAAKAPFEPLADGNSLHDIVTKYRRRAGLSLNEPGRRGMHSLRHSVATNMLRAGVPIDSIAGILGHKSLDSTMIYTKVDVDALRGAALEVEI